MAPDARSKDIEDVLILSGDHLYRMDDMDFVQNHQNSGADITISSLPMDDKNKLDRGAMVYFKKNVPHIEKAIMKMESRIMDNLNYKVSVKALNETSMSFVSSCSSYFAP